MERVFLQQVDSNYLRSLPQEPGNFGFYGKGELLYLAKTGNLQRRLGQLFALQAELELFQRADLLVWKAQPSLLEALITEKVVLSRAIPEFNSSIPPWRDYVYLAINPQEFPFVKIAEYTDSDWFYVGPWRSRFFLIDTLQLIQKLLKLPYCEDNKYPCDKLEAGLCRGWCQLVNIEDEEEGSKHVQKLDALLREAFVHADNGLLEMIQHQKDKYEDELEFGKADLLTDEIELLTKYKEWLIFLYTAKALSYDTQYISVREGQLVGLHQYAEEESFPLKTAYLNVGDNRIHGARDFSFPAVSIKYRDNEVLALNKNIADESWILYKHWQEIKNKSDV